MAIRTAELIGSTYVSCQGGYQENPDSLIKGKPIWERISPDSSKFIFFCNGKWKITGSHWKGGMVASNGGGCGAYIASDNNGGEW